MNLFDNPEAVATVAVGLLGWIIVYTGWLGRRRRERIDARGRQVALADELLVAIVAYRASLEAHHVRWSSLESRWKTVLLAAAHLVEGRARHKIAFAGLGGAARAVLEWDAGGVAAAQLMSAQVERIAVAALALDGCGDRALAAASLRVVDALPQTAGGRKAWGELEASAQAVAAERRRIARR